MKRKALRLSKQFRSAEIRAESFSEAENSVEIVWTTGASVRRYSWRDGAYYDEELVVEPGAVRLDRLNNGAPLLNSHSDYSLSDIIGAIIPGSAKIENGQGIATVRLSSTPGDAEVVQKVRAGIIKNTSVGYRIHRIEKIEGDDGSVPVWRVVDWEPLEVSLVAVPAGPGSQVRSAPADNEELFDAVLVAGDYADSYVADDEESRAEVINERLRCMEIIGLVREAGFSASLATKLIRDGSSVEEVRESLSPERSGVPEN